LWITRAFTEVPKRDANVEREEREQRDLRATSFEPNCWSSSRRCRETTRLLYPRRRFRDHFAASRHAAPYCFLTYQKVKFVTLVTTVPTKFDFL